MSGNQPTGILRPVGPFDHGFEKVTRLRKDVDHARNGDRLIIEAREDQPLPKGARVGVRFDKANAYLFDAKTEARLR